LADITDLIKSVTESEYWTQLRSDYDLAKVQWRSWGTRNPFLVVSRFSTKAAEVLREAVRVIAESGFLDFASGLGLVLFARSQYQLDRQPATFTVGRVVLDMSAVVAPAPVSAGQLQVWTPGPITADSRMFVSLESGTLNPGEANVLRFTALGSGDLYNLPVGTPIELKTSIPGVTASLRASGPPVRLGLGNASLIVWAARPDVYVEIVDPGLPGLPLTIVGNTHTLRLTITLATDSFATPISTASEVRKAIGDAIASGANVKDLLLTAALGGDGTGLVQVLPLTLLDWTGTWIESYAHNEQDDDSLKQDCANRFPTMGGASGDGAPVSTAQTEDALLFWGKRPPAGYNRSPVEKIQVYTNIDDTGAVDGAAVLVVISGASGPLAPAAVNAVAGNYENPRKYSYGITLRTISAEARTIAVSGLVTIRRSSGRSIAEVQASIAKAFIRFSADRAENAIGAEIDNTKINAVVIDADRAAIKSFAPSAPLAPVVLTFKQVAQYDLSGLTYALA